MNGETVKEKLEKNKEKRANKEKKDRKKIFKRNKDNQGLGENEWL